MLRFLVSSRRAPGHASPLGPGGRPFVRWRLLAALLASTALSGTAALLLSDRAPGLLRRLSARIDAGSSAAAQLASQTRPQSDFEIHVLLWAFVTVFVGLATWSSRSLLISAIAVLVLSAVVERAQDVLTQTRHFHVADLVANLVGVSAALGLVSGLAILLGWNDAPHQQPSP